MKSKKELTWVEIEDMWNKMIIQDKQAKPIKPTLSNYAKNTHGVRSYIRDFIKYKNVAKTP